MKIYCFCVWEAAFDGFVLHKHLVCEYFNLVHFSRITSKIPGAHKIVKNLKWLLLVLTAPNKTLHILRFCAGLGTKWRALFSVSYGVERFYLRGQRNNWVVDQLTKLVREMVGCFFLRKCR